MSKKKGRPKKDISKEYRLNVRLSIGDASAETNYCTYKKSAY